MKNGINTEFASHVSLLPSLAWKNLSEQDRILKVESVMKGFTNSEVIQVKKAYSDGQVTISLNNAMNASERGSFLLDFEELLKDNLDNGITIWHEAIGDKNSLRNLRGIEVVSIEEAL